jgi:dethiobiotin synthetase
VGKTVVTAALARARGESVAVIKPAQTGVLPGEPGDTDEVRRLADLPSLAGSLGLARYRMTWRCSAA